MIECIGRCMGLCDISSTFEVNLFFRLIDLKLIFAAFEGKYLFTKQNNSSSQFCLHTIN